jgi:hypothetical protein
MNSRLYLSGDGTFNSRLFVLTDVSFLGRLFVSNDVSLNGNVSIGNDLTINGRLSVKQYQNINIINTTTNNYSLIVSEDLSLNGRFYSTGDVSFNSNIFINQKSIQNGDVSMNSRLFVSSDASFNSGLYANVFRFGSTPITKYYNWNGSVSTSISPIIQISFNNNSYYAKIHAFVYEINNNNSTSTQILEVQGGNVNSGSPQNIVLLSALSFPQYYTWNIPTTNTNTITLTTNDTASDNTTYYVIRIELIQTNLSQTAVPAVTSIQFNNLNNGNTSTITSYQY